jgi:hypothetical protein
MKKLTAIMIVANIITRNFIFIVRLLVKLASMNETLMRLSNGRIRFIGTVSMNKGTCICSVSQNIERKHPAQNKRRIHISSCIKSAKLRQRALIYHYYLYIFAFYHYYLYIIAFYIVKYDIYYILISV